MGYCRRASMSKIALTRQTGPDWQRYVGSRPSLASLARPEKIRRAGARPHEWREALVPPWSVEIHLFPLAMSKSDKLTTVCKANLRPPPTPPSWSSSIVDAQDLYRKFARLSADATATSTRGLWASIERPGLNGARGSACPSTQSR